VINPNWYAELLAFNAEQNLTEAITQDVADSFRNVTTFTSIAEPAFQDPTAATFRVVRPLPVGPMLGRIALGKATILIGDTEYDVFCEFVQPYNFSYATASSYTFLSPTWEQNMTDEQGYTSITISTDAGPQAVVEQSLFFTESCGEIGWIGSSGFDCRRCPAGLARSGWFFIWRGASGSCFSVGLGHHFLLDRTLCSLCRPNRRCFLS
jgi:hypothetical protein